MQLGIVTPVVTRLPRAHATWEETAGIEEIARVAVEADRLGYHHLTCSEHVALPRELVATRGGTYWDPLPVFGYVAARTSAIRLATHVLVLGYHHPLAIAKR
jgi:alkanesulfonate monooxygenase SsuD/methylene tetrahydromethanopterin reductase-like flavin-dependent oxidoreductase (luciferase family)